VVEEPRESSADFDTPPPVSGGVVDVYEPSPQAMRSRTARRWALRLSLILGGMALVAIFGLVTNGTRVLADFWLASAYGHYLDRDLPAAIDKLDRGLAWFPDDSMLILMRAQFRSENQDLAGSLADYDRVIALAPEFAEAYTGRSRVYQRLDRHAEAIADLERARDLRPAREALPLNNLAYARALAGGDLEQGLAEVQQAIEQEQDSPERFTFLDTRGYLFHLLERNDEALADLDRAIELGEKARDEDLALATEQELPEAKLARLKRVHDEHLAVIYHHRGEVHQALGHAEQAEFDLRRGNELGYSLERGVY
jgi:tetratricopeptide (TPR) repeat protein